jgi:hypothetical protein
MCYSHILSQDLVSLLTKFQVDIGSRHRFNLVTFPIYFKTHVYPRGCRWAIPVTYSNIIIVPVIHFTPFFLSPEQRSEPELTMLPVN